LQEQRFLFQLLLLLLLLLLLFECVSMPRGMTALVKNNQNTTKGKERDRHTMRF